KPQPRAGDHRRAGHARGEHRALRQARHPLPRRSDRVRRCPSTGPGRQEPLHPPREGRDAVKLFRMTLMTALRALRRNKLRSALTMLGIIIGVAAVITMVSIAADSSAVVHAEIRSLA